MDFNESNNPSVDRLVTMYDTLKSLGILPTELERDASVLSVIKSFNSLFKDQA